MHQTFTNWAAMALTGAAAGLILGSAVLAGCGNVDQPKPHAYFRLNLPEKTYATYSGDKYPFSFEYPSNVSLVRPKPETKGDKYGLNISYPSLRACIYCDYKPVNGNFREISEDFRTFVYKHTAKADAITEQPFINPEARVWGLLYEIKGNAASQLQFVLTDSSSHYFRGALYFNSVPNADSLSPAVDYIKDDIMRIMESFKWDSSGPRLAR